MNENNPDGCAIVFLLKTTKMSKYAHELSNLRPRSPKLVVYTENGDLLLNIKQMLDHLQITNKQNNLHFLFPAAACGQQSPTMYNYRHD